MLMNTHLLLPPRIRLPEDISDLIQGAYSSNGVEVPEEWQDKYDNAKMIQTKKIKESEDRADTFKIGLSPKSKGTLVGMLTISVKGDTSDKSDRSGKRAEATVRDSDETLEVIIVQKKDDKLFTLPGLEKYSEHEIPTDTIPEESLAATIAGCTVRLPHALCFPGQIHRTIEALEMSARDNHLDAWMESPWLTGELFLILDKNNEAVLSERKLRYTIHAGLHLIKEAENDRERQI
jgi:hypothetical protein